MTPANENFPQDVADRLLTVQRNLKLAIAGAAPVLKALNEELEVIRDFVLSNPTAATAAAEKAPADPSQPNAAAADQAALAERCKASFRQNRPAGAALAARPGLH